MIRFKMKRCLPTTLLIAAGALMLMLICGGAATADIYYSDSAHGDTGNGVNRSTATCVNWPGGACSTGSCAHCHDTYDPDICGNDTHGLMLFASNSSPGSQTDNFCFQCHKGTGSVQVGGVTNNTYSTNFGGGTATFTTIYDAFNPATGDTPSSHNLADVLDHAVGLGVGITSNTNACLVCHDQHGSQQNYPVTLSGLGGVLTAIRRPADFPSPGNPSNLWGDESGNNELMSEYTNKYQAPYYVGGFNFEPANDSTSDGSNLPNLKAFCTNNCHGTGNVWSTERGAGLRRIDWSNDTYNDEHGKTNDYNGQIGDTKAPYTNQTANYVLACTDCHEPHGSENEWLLRTTVNGTDVNIPGPNKWWYFCGACHKGNDPWAEDWPANQHTAPWNADTDCYNNGICHHHDAGGGMF